MVIGKHYKSETEHVISWIKGYKLHDQFQLLGSGPKR